LYFDFLPVHQIKKKLHFQVIFYLHDRYLMLYSLYWIVVQYNILIHYTKSINDQLIHYPDKKGELWE